MRRWLAMVLCAVLLVGVLPVVAGADEEGGFAGPFGPNPGDSGKTASRELMDSDWLTLSSGFNRSESFSIDNDTYKDNSYFMVVAQWANNSPQQNGFWCFDESYDKSGSDNVRCIYRCICFFKDVPEGEPVLVGDQTGTGTTDELEAIKAAFNNSLNLALYAESDGPMKQFPAMWTNISSDSGWACPYIYELDNHTMGGRWIWKATGIINGKEIQATSAFTITVRDSIIIDATQQNDPITYINNELKNKNTSQEGEVEQCLEVLLPSGNVTGDIIVPVDIAYDVFLVGTDGGPGKGRTQLNGSVFTQNPDKQVTVEDISFVSAKEKSAENNYAVSGQSSGEIHNCSFSGYNHAIHCTGGLNFGGYNCWFENNDVAIFIASPQGIGNTDLLNHTFLTNRTAVEIASFSNDDPLRIVQCKFLGNSIDFVNQTGRFQNASYSYFYHGTLNFEPDVPYSTPYQKANESYYLPMVEGNTIGDKAPLIACPLSKDEDFSGYFIPSTNAYMLNASAEIETNLLPGKSISVIGENGQDIGTWSFNSVEEGGH